MARLFLAFHPDDTELVPHPDGGLAASVTCAAVANGLRETAVALTGDPSAVISLEAGQERQLPAWAIQTSPRGVEHFASAAGAGLSYFHPDLQGIVPRSGRVECYAGGLLVWADWAPGAGAGAPQDNATAAKVSS